MFNRLHRYKGTQQARFGDRRSLRASDVQRYARMSSVAASNGVSSCSGMSAPPSCAALVAFIALLAITPT